MRFLNSVGVAVGCLGVFSSLPGAAQQGTTTQGTSLQSQSCVEGGLSGEDEVVFSKLCKRLVDDFGIESKIDGNSNIQKRSC